ncbi:UNVERIFIED_CONTAM: hypothetical protein PYX00_009132 [Menopon gallinae]|uniref:Uncharacterized protein n=1 Tax=Menopon gallinae TaxID=328185 RepID=A0AAW2HA57_9NEOP
MVPTSASSPHTRRNKKWATVHRCGPRSLFRRTGGRRRSNLCNRNDPTNLIAAPKRAIFQVWLWVFLVSVALSVRTEELNNRGATYDFLAPLGLVSGLEKNSVPDLRKSDRRRLPCCSPSWPGGFGYRFFQESTPSDESLILSTSAWERKESRCYLCPRVSQVPSPVGDVRNPNLNTPSSQAARAQAASPVLINTHAICKRGWDPPPTGP